MAGWCLAQGFGRVTRIQSVGGGCINHGARLETESGQTCFLKSNPSAPADMFQREAEGLTALAAPDGPRFPRPLLAGPDFLLLDDLAPPMVVTEKTNLCLNAFEGVTVGNFPQRFQKFSS